MMQDENGYSVETVEVTFNNPGQPTEEDASWDNSPEGRPVQVHRGECEGGSTGPLKT